jgi:hypothetical protein
MQEKSLTGRRREKEAVISPLQWTSEEVQQQHSRRMEMVAQREGTQLKRHLTIALIAILMLFTGLLSPNGWGQTDRGSISGTVVDPTGAVVTGVQVSITDSVTKVGYSGSTTNDHGAYQILNLPIGKYSLVFKREGFKQYDRNGITVSASQEAKVDVKLQVGGISETVTVNSDAAVLDSYTATEATSVAGSAIEELPLPIAGGRNAAAFAVMVVPTVNAGQGVAGYATSGISIANSLTQSNNVMVDGIDADAGYQGGAAASAGWGNASPGVEAVREVRVETSGIDAESSQTGGGTLQYELKSGTDKIHASAFGFMTNEALDANSWSNNYWMAFCNVGGAGSSGQCPAAVAATSTTPSAEGYEQLYRRPTDRLKDWGFSAGGPIWKQHTFVFGAYERYNQNTMAWGANGTTVPTTNMLDGDFSQLLTYGAVAGLTANEAIGGTGSCASYTNAAIPVPCPTGYLDAGGNPIYYGAIFDPANPGHVFAGNLIPSISVQSQGVINIYKQDYAPTNSNLINNYWGFSGSTNEVQNLDIKLDHNFSANHHVSGSIDWAKSESIGLGNHNGGNLWQRGSSTGGPFADAQGAPQKFATIHLTDNYTLKPNLLNSFIVAFNWNNKADVTPASAGSDFSPAAGSLYPNLGYSSILGVNQSTVGQDFEDDIRWQQWRLKDSVSWVHGRHVVKFGGEYTAYNQLNKNPGGILSYNFNDLTGLPQNVANDTTASSALGYGLANMMLGEVASAKQTVTTGSDTTRQGADMFVSDQMIATHKLTLNFSLRWDVNSRLHEKNGNWSNWDLTAQNPNWVAAAGNTGLLGNIAYLASSGGSFETNEDYRLFSPHVGAAYQLSPKLVLRGAWGLFYVPIGQNMWGGVPYESEGCFNCFGANNSAPGASNVDPSFQWDANIYPGVAIPAAKNANANDFGWGLGYATPDTLKLGRTQNWNLGFEYGINANTVVDVRYMGNVGYDLHDPSLYPQNYPTWSQYYPLLMSGHAGDNIASQANAVAAGVPWYPFLTTMNGGCGGYSAESAITPQPQTTACWGSKLAVTGNPRGNSGFNGVVAEIKKRAGSGLSMDLSYTLSKAVGNVIGVNQVDEWYMGSEFQDPYSYGQFKNLVSPGDIRHQVKGYASYNLPLGRNGRWLQRSKNLDYLVGGWTLSGDVNYHTGLPMAAVGATNGYPSWSQTFANTTGVSLANHFKHLDLANLNDVSNQFFSPAAFSDQTLSTSNPLYGTFGNQLPYNNNWRGWAYYNEDFSAVKHFAVGPGSRIKASIRAEFFDLLNRHQWGLPNTSYTSPQFGNVTGVSGNRKGQVGARIEW